MSSYPRLKAGVQLLHTEPFIGSFIGLQTHGVQFTDSQLAAIARAFDGSHRITEIAAALRLDPYEVTEVASALLSAGLLEFSATPQRRQSVSTTHGEVGNSFRADQQKLELDLITHREGRTDGGAGELEARSRYTILISGENRLARTLLALLQSMGIVHSRIITRGQVALHITPHDLCTMTTRMSDVGKLRNDFHKEIIRESALPNGESVAKAAPDLIISTVPIEWDYVQRWMSEGTNYIHISQVIGAHLEIGPLVIPGKSACLRCVALTKRDARLPTAVEAIRGELTSATIARVAGLVSALVAEFIETGTSPLLGASIWLDLLKPLEQPERRYWAHHGECGCTN